MRESASETGARGGIFNYLAPYFTNAQVGVAHRLSIVCGYCAWPASPSAVTDLVGLGRASALSAYRREPRVPHVDDDLPGAVGLLLPGVEVPDLISTRWALGLVDGDLFRNTIYEIPTFERDGFTHTVCRGNGDAEVLLDAVSAVTGIDESFGGVPVGYRAIQLWDNRMPSYFLETFGRSERKSPCECAKSSEPTMAQALHLMNK